MRPVLRHIKEFGTDDISMSSVPDYLPLSPVAMTNFNAARTDDFLQKTWRNLSTQNVQSELRKKQVTLHELYTYILNNYISYKDI